MQAAGIQNVVKQVHMLAPLGIVYLCNKYDVEQAGLTNHVRLGYVAVNILALLMLAFAKSRIESDEETKIEVPPQMAMGKEVAPAKTLTKMDYEVGAWKEEVKKILMTAGILSVIHWNFGAIMPLILQSVMIPLQIIASPIIRAYVFGEEIARPFPTAPSPFAEFQDRLEEVKKQMNEMNELQNEGANNDKSNDDGEGDDKKESEGDATSKTKEAKKDK